MRYAFVLVERNFDGPLAELPLSLRRQTIHLLWTVALTGCSAPVIATRGSAVPAAVGLAALSVSFVNDVIWLARDARRVR